MSDGARRWLEVRVRSSTPGDAGALLADVLVSLGARGAEERGPWQVAYFEEPEDTNAFLDALRTAFADEPGVGTVHLEHGWQGHEEWAETWKRGLGERRLTDRVIVHPSWIEPADVREGDVVVVLDPGMAFGTAEHGTTRGCVRLMDRTVRPHDRILDVGSGSGILAIVAARIGADHVVAIEADALACEALAENVERNGVEDRVEVVEAFATEDSVAGYGPVSGIIANIEAGLLEPLFDGFARALPPGAWLIVSGILDHEWEAVRARVEASGFVFHEVDADGPWRSGRFERSVA
jgi:ribosomal protein L11 methyltransferase